MVLKCGHDESHLKWVNSKARKSGGFMRCQECQREARTRYNRTPKGMEKNRQYALSPKGRENRKRYRRSPKGKEAQRRSNAKRMRLGDLYIGYHSGFTKAEREEILNGKAD